MIRVRPALLSDLEAIEAVSVRAGLSSFDVEERKNWLLSHPFRKEFEGVPWGWVLESNGGEIVGTFSNIHMMYELDGKRYKCGIAGSWGVEVEHRNSSLLLALSYLGQKGVDLCLNGSASSVASRLMTTLKVPRIASEDYDLSYLWVTRRRAFATAALRNKKIPAAGLLAQLVGLGLWLSDFRRRDQKRSVVGLKQFDEFGGEFDSFWEKLRCGHGRLRAVRTSAALQWRFGSGLRQNRAVVLGIMANRELLGYVVLREKDRAHLRLRQFVIADLQALKDSKDILLDLLSAAIATTRDQEKDVLEWQGWNSTKRQSARSTHPKSYRYPVWPLYYKAINSSLVSALSNAGSWDFSPFDAF